MRSRVLAIAGSDSGGGAGIQADIKTITALGGYAATAITALTVQDTRAVYAVHPVPPSFVTCQIEHALADPGADAVKVGMLAEKAVVAAVAAALRPAAGIPIVVDPVIMASSGRRLLAEDALAVLRSDLFPLATLITPNIPEAELLSGITIRDRPSMERAARALGPGAVLVKGGHLPGETVMDVLASPEAVIWFDSPRFPGPPRHGTGCTLASAIAAGLAQGLLLPGAIRRARAYVHAAIAAGTGSLNHAVTLDPDRIGALRD